MVSTAMNDNGQPRFFRIEGVANEFERVARDSKVPSEANVGFSRMTPNHATRIDQTDSILTEWTFHFDGMDFPF